MEPDTLLANQYAASELAGALLLGRYARKTTDNYLRRKLTWHCAEEARHASLWESLLSSLELQRIPVHDDKKTDYFAYADECEHIIDFLAFVHVYEHRVPTHFAAHADYTNNKPLQALLRKLIKEEDSHLDWIRQYLEEQHLQGDDRVEQSLKKFTRIEQRTYDEFLAQLRRTGQDDFADHLEQALADHKGPLHDNPLPQRQ